MDTKSKNPPRSVFGRALRQARKAQGIPQEQFDEASSRTYISALERGIKQPTLAKVDDLAAVLGVHPLSLLTLSYCKPLGQSSLEQLVNIVLLEVAQLDPALKVEERT
jgi:transcriptional regulator with XRE-family HTH domain